MNDQSERIKQLEAIGQELNRLLMQKTRECVAATEAVRAADAAARSRDAEIGRLHEMVINAKIQTARREGYIERVRERDAVTSTAVRNPAPGDIIELDEVREAMVHASEDGLGRIINSMSQSTFERVMGRDPNVQSDILR